MSPNLANRIVKDNVDARVTIKVFLLLTFVGDKESKSF